MYPTRIISYITLFKKFTFMQINLTLLAIGNIQKENIYTEYFTEKKDDRDCKRDESVFLLNLN
jgi:hypothetical protein